MTQEPGERLKQNPEKDKTRTQRKIKPEPIEDDTRTQRKV